jgi:hypothetical protein
MTQVNTADRTRACGKCGATDWNPGNRCRPCTKAMTDAYKAANLGKKKANDAAYRLENKEKVKAATLAWRASNKDHIKAVCDAWKKANPEKVKEMACSAYLRHREKHLEKNKARKIANKSKYAAVSAIWRKNNKPKIAAWRAANPDRNRINQHNRRARERSGGRLSPNLRDKLLRLQKGKCACCKKPLGSNYHMDHIFPLALGGLNVDDNIQLLRQRCNQQKSKKHPIDFMQERGFLL